MQMTLRNKIYVIATVLCLVTVVSSYITYQNFQQISGSSLRIIDVEMPLEESLLGMKISTSESTRAVLDYIQDYQSKHIDIMKSSEDDFEKHVSDFIDLTETDNEKQLGQEVNLLHVEYQTVGYEIISLQDHQNELLLSLRERVNNTMYSFEELAQLYVGSTRPDAIPHMMAILEMVRLVSELHTEVEGVIAKHNPSFELNLTYYSTKLQEAQLTYGGTLTDYNEKEKLRKIYTDIQDILDKSEELVSTTDILSNRLEEFENYHEQIDMVLENEILLVNEKKERTAQNALYSSSITLGASVFDSVFGFLLIGGLLYGINRWMIAPVLELSTEIKKFGAESQTRKIEIRSQDEIGQLANAFNQMTTQIEETIETISKNERELEQLNLNLENEIAVRKQYEEEMLRVAREAELDKMRSQFLSTITHELRTPLTSIKGYIDIIRAGWVGELPEEMDELLEVVIRNTDRLSTLTNDLLDVQRIETGKLDIEPTIFDFNEVIQRCILEIKPFLIEKNQTLETDIPEYPLTVHGDEERLSQVIMNLLNNASKFSAEGKPITLKADYDKEKVKISVTDQGIGIQKEDLERIFEPLAMIEKPIYVKGTGLGLSVSKGIIELHEGKIWADSQGEWKGSTFHITLPTGKEVKT